MFGRCPLIKGYFRRYAGRGCGHVFGLSLAYGRLRRRTAAQDGCLGGSGLAILEVIAPAGFEKSTRKFLEAFGFASLRDLPDIERLEAEDLLQNGESESDLDRARGLATDEEYPSMSMENSIAQMDTDFRRAPVGVRDRQIV
jgi:hypothetical protein